jgi:hypothetical protein
MPSTPLNLDAAIAAADQDMLNYLTPTLEYLASGMEPGDSFITCDVKKRRACIKIVRKDGITFVITVEKRGN